MVYCDHQVLFVVYLITKFIISSLLWICVHPSYVEVIVIVFWLCALSLLCRSDWSFGFVPPCVEVIVV